MRHTASSPGPAAQSPLERREEVIRLRPETAALILHIVRLGFVIVLVVLIGLGL